MAHAGEHKDTTFLKTEIKTIHRLTPAHARGLALLGLHAIEDVLRYTPARYINYNEATTSNTLIDGQVATVYGKLEKVKVRKSWRTKVNMTEACLSDITGQIKLVWFNQPFIGKMYPEGTLVRISGKVTNGQFLNPLIDKVSNLPDTTQSLFFSPPEGNEKTRQANYVPVYRETKGVSSLFLNELVKKIVHLPAFKSIDDPLPLHIRQELSLPNLRESIVYAHIPRDDKDILAAQKRFLFEEMFTIQLRIETERAKAKQSISYTIGDVDMDRFFKLHNFTPTSAQKRALDAILGDLQRSKKQGNRKQDSNAQSYPMQRLLEGDVGSGKTLVAAAASYAVILEKRDQKQFGTPLQVAYLAPTEVLAYQQFEGFIKFLSHTGIEIGYLSGTKALKFPSKTNPNEATKVSRAQLLKWVKEGRISMLIGTHAITKKSVEFKDLALIIIDEQHRFGINSRKELAHKRGDKRPEIPHLLSMTATPIPRTLALALFGDLDLTIIDELPAGRQKITTRLASEKQRDKIYEHIEKEISEGRQCFVICTRIENSDDESQSKRRSVADEVKELKKRFPNFTIQGMSSKLKAEEKERIMNEFQDNKINILVSTSVIEVGINVPNATLMVIENAEVFGLSQLHQLRGRIGRGSHASTCYLFTASDGEKTLKRLKQFVETDSGFALAELDLRERGAGSLISSNQSGLSDIAMEALKNMRLVEMAKKYAKEIIENDPTLENFPELYTKVIRLEHLHLE